MGERSEDEPGAGDAGAQRLGAFPPPVAVAPGAEDKRAMASLSAAEGATAGAITPLPESKTSQPATALPCCGCSAHSSPR